MSDYPMKISVKDYAKMRDQKTPHVFLDVRENDEVVWGSLPRAVHMPMGQVSARKFELPDNIPIIVGCRIGGRSAIVVQQLRAFGFNCVANLQGGLLAWKREIDPGLQIR